MTSVSHLHLVKLLSEHAILPESRQYDWLKQRKTIELNSGEELVAAHSEVDSIFVVETGLLRAVYTTAEGKEFSKEFYWEKDVILSLRSLISGAELPYAIKACEPTVVYALPAKTYQELYDSDLHWLNYHLAQVQRHVLFKEIKEELLLLHSNEERVLEVYRLFPDFVKRVPAVMLASYLGITPESLSRIKKRSNLA